MKRTMIILAAHLLVMMAAAQDPTVKKLQAEANKSIAKPEDDTVKRTWRRGGLYTLAVGQGSLSNWASGGDNFSITITTILNLFSFYQKAEHSWDNVLDVNLGYLKTTSLGGRKNDDRLDYLSKYGFALSPKFDLTGLFNFRSQFFRGYTYDNDIKTISSAFLSPAYILLGAGVNYKPTENLSIFLSPITSRWIIVKDDTLAAKGAYGVDSSKHSINELGAFTTISYRKNFNKVVAYIGRLDLYSNYKHKPKNIDVYMTNTLSVKLGKIISLTWSVDMIYDDDVRLFGKNRSSPALQLKSIVGFGLQVKF